MTSIARAIQDPATLWRRLVNTWRSTFMQGDITTLLITIILLVMPALALQTAEWPVELPTVIPVVIMSVIFGFVLARSPYNEFFALIVSAVYGGVTILFVASVNEPGGLLDGFTSVLQRTMNWTVDALTGGINQDSLVFSLLVATLFWYLGYNAVWHIFRIDRVWRVILPPGMILITNMLVYTGTANLDIHLAVFAFMSLLLIVRSNLDAREWEWYVNGIRVPRHLRNQFIRVGAVISLIALTVAWAIPKNDLDQQLDNFQQLLQSDPVQELAELWNRLFEPVESEGPATADYYGGDSLRLGGAISLGDQTVFNVQTSPDRRYYWKSRVFEVYSGGRWQSSATRRVSDLAAPTDLVLNDQLIGGARTDVTQTFMMADSTRLIHAAPQILRADLPTRYDVYRITGNQDDTNSPVNLFVMRPARVLNRGASYTVTSAMSDATAFELREAGTNYPEWITNPNAIIGGAISEEVKQLARQIVTSANATNPYDQAKAIETWLRTNIIYNERIPVPPENVDPVWWFLNTQREGYCTYYATAMVTMLRSLGVPARMAAGFAQGELDPATNQYIVRERDAHTWVEVYFPGYGWVEFEPTSAQDPLNREGDLPQQVAPPQVAEVQPTAEPTQTPTLIPSPTPEATLPPDEVNQQQPPTVTPTPTPTPTVTPFIVPTVEPPMEPPPADNFLSFLLPAIGAAVLLFLGVLALILFALFIYWWWEWRGMGGMSPVSRAYARLERYVRLIGIYPGETDTPEEKRQTIVKKLPTAERPVSAIARTYIQERYGQPASDDERDYQDEIADESWGQARTNILQRWLSKFIPWMRS